MEFTDELRRIKQSSAKKRLSDSEVYQKILDSHYSRIKMFLRGQAADSDSNTISVKFTMYLNEKEGINPNDIEHRDSDMFCVYTDADRDSYVALRPLCVVSIKPGGMFSSPKVEGSLTAAGYRFTNDLISLGKRDGIRIWFAPEYMHTELKGFDSFETTQHSSSDPRANLVVHCEVSL